jgi:hypothetical protein
MSTYEPQVGDQVEVVLRGKVTSAGPSWANCFWIARTNLINPSHRHVVSVERLPDPEPERQTGDVVLDGAGRVFRCRLGARGEPVWGGWHGHWFGDDELVRPLTLLVRDGKVVQL